MKKILLVLMLFVVVFCGYGRTFVETRQGTSVTTIDNYTLLIQQGECYYCENVYTIASGATVDIVFDASGMTRGLRAYPTTWGTTAGPVTVTLGTCASYTGGTALTEINRNYAYNSNEVDLTYGATITDGSFPSYPTVLVGGASTQQNSAGGVLAGSLPIILNNNEIYVFRVINGAGEEIKLYSDIIWFEVSGSY